MSSSPAEKTGPRLEITKDVELRDGRLFAESDEPWLLLVDGSLRRGRSRFIEITYWVDAIEPPVRPILRLWFGREHWRDVIMPAPTDGYGVWIGRLPRGWTELWISPTNRSGETSFTIVDVQSPSLASVARRLMRNPKRLFFALSAEMVGLHEEAELNWRWALGREPPGAYTGWRAARRPRGQSRARSGAPLFCEIFLDVGKASASQIDESCRAIARQSHDAWRVSFLGRPANEDAAQRLSAWAQEPRFGDCRDIASSSLACRLQAGDLLDQEALAAFARFFDRHPEIALAYSDATQIGQSGRLSRIWRPGWSPTLQRSVDYVGRGFFSGAGS
jgi:O-antigen biosynthesis protein